MCLCDQWVWLSTLSILERHHVWLCLILQCVASILFHMVQQRLMKPQSQEYSDGITQEHIYSHNSNNRSPMSLCLCVWELLNTWTDYYLTLCECSQWPRGVTEHFDLNSKNWCFANFGYEIGKGWRMH